MDQPDERRRELELEAYGSDVPAERRRAAVRALAALDESPGGNPPSAQPRPRARSSRVIAIALIALVVGVAGGLAGGVGFARSEHASTATSTATADPVAAAEDLLTSPRTSVDTLPTLQATNGAIVASTSHLVSTSAQGERLFVARGSGARGGFCLVTVQDDHAFGGSGGAVHCVRAATFARTGVALTSAGYTAHWVGGRVDLSVTGG